MSACSGEEELETVTLEASSHVGSRDSKDLTWDGYFGDGEKEDGLES